MVPSLVIFICPVLLFDSYLTCSPFISGILPAAVMVKCLLLHQKFKKTPGKPFSVLMVFIFQLLLFVCFAPPSHYFCLQHHRLQHKDPSSTPAYELYQLQAKNRTCYSFVICLIRKYLLSQNPIYLQRKSKLTSEGK